MMHDVNAIFIYRFDIIPLKIGYCVAIVQCMQKVETQAKIKPGVMAVKDNEIFLL